LLVAVEVHAERCEDAYEGRRRDEDPADLIGGGVPSDATPLK
jgi:hypothetical protein